MYEKNMSGPNILRNIYFLFLPVKNRECFRYLLLSNRNTLSNSMKFKSTELYVKQSICRALQIVTIILLLLYCCFTSTVNIKGLVGTVS